MNSIFLLPISFLCYMIQTVSDFKNPFFIGIGGVGMSAIAMYLKEMGMQVAGSDRLFAPESSNDTQEKLVASGIACYPQDGSGILPNTDLVIASTAIEETVPEVIKARQLGIPIVKRAELLAIIANHTHTIAIGGTSGKSTTAAMLYDILLVAGLQPSIITGAGLISLISPTNTGNAKLGNGQWLIIEADESDGTIVNYKPQIGVLLNIDKDHKELGELTEIFTIFKNNSKNFIVNQSSASASKLSENIATDFSSGGEAAGIAASQFIQDGFHISFAVQEVLFNIPAIGKHNMENALAAIAVAVQLGVSLATCAEALGNYKGIYRRNQILGNKNGVWVIDDYAHNPVKCAAAINACKPLAAKVIAWFQPHGYGPTRFLRNDFVVEIAQSLRADDEIWMSEIYFAGGTTTKDISAADLINDINAQNKKAFFVNDRNDLLAAIRPHFTTDCVLLLMGARDPSLEKFVHTLWKNL